MERVGMFISSVSSNAERNGSPVALEGVCTLRERFRLVQTATLSRASESAATTAGDFESVIYSASIEKWGEF